MFVCSCASNDRAAPRLPDKILNCEQLKEKMKIRAQLVQRVEGKAFMKDSSGRWQVLISMRADRQFWIEIRSPLGGTFAVLRADEDWVEFYIPRRKEMYRLPTSEFWRISPRQIRFLNLLPVKFKPEQMMNLIFGRIDPEKVISCQWSPKLRAYVVVTKEDRRESFTVIDPISHFPIQSGGETDVFMVKQSGGRVYTSETLEFGAAFDFYQNRVKELSFEWIELSWRAEMGSKPPFFPESLAVKKINY